MLPFRNALFNMLSGALIAQAHLHLSNFEIEDAAASIFVNRAIANIEKENAARAAQYRAAVQAIQDLPKFLSRIRRQTTDNQFLSESSANDLLKTLTVDCIYPWCTDKP